MSDHNETLVPLESWCYASPELRAAGRAVDIGLFAEALIYYESVIINPTNQPQLAEFLQWFVQQERLADFISLLRDGTIKVYDYAFATTAIQNKGSYLIYNIQDEIQVKPNTFEQRFLYHPTVEAVFPSKGRHRTRIYEAFRGNVIEVKADDFGSPVENARDDYKDARRNSVIVQAFVDELYRIKQLGRPPDVQAKVVSSPDGTKHQITWNIDFSDLTKLAGPELSFHLGTPLTAGAHSNRLIWSAAQLNCDLYLPRPMSMLVGDKLYESAETVAKAGNIIEQMKTAVEFPDVRGLVNSGNLHLSDVLKIRKKAQRFRDWLQDESDRDRDAIIAYHNEVAIEAGMVRGARKALNLFGVIGGGATGAYVGTLLGGPAGGALGGAVGGAVGYLAEVTSKFGENWRPVVFGDWLQDRIEKVVHSRNDKVR
jgi:hypothetical protein